MEREGDIWLERAIRDAVLAGDREIWRSWYDAHFAQLAEYVGWRCGGIPDLTEDIVQETWLTAIHKLRTFDPARGRFYAWLCGIASNAARNAVRARLRHVRRTRPLDASPEPAGAAPDPVPVDRQQRVAATLAELPDRYEKALRAKYVDKLTVDEIAATDGITPKAVESLLARARRAFREAFEMSHD